jgi:hypothetical protein
LAAPEYATTGYDAGVDLRYLLNMQWSFNGSFMGTMEELHLVLRFVFRGQLESREQFCKVIERPE